MLPVLYQCPVLKHQLQHPVVHVLYIATSSPSTSTSNCSTSSSEIPSVWTASTQKCLNEKRVTPDVQREIVHTLSVMIMANSRTLLDCERVANSIIIKYPFLADPFGKVCLLFNHSYIHNI